MGKANTQQPFSILYICHIYVCTYFILVLTYIIYIHTQYNIALQDNEHTILINIWVTVLTYINLLNEVLDGLEKQLVMEGTTSGSLRNHDGISLLDGHWNVLEQV